MSAGKTWSPVLVSRPWKRETQHPLAHGLLRQYLVDQQHRTFGHPTRPATGTKSTALTAEGDQALGVTRLAAHPQKAVFQPAAFEVVLKFSLYIDRQLPALLRQMGRECRVILFDDPIEKGLCGPVALVTTSTSVPASHPGRHLGHDPRTVESLRVSFSTSSLTLRSSLRHRSFGQSIAQLHALVTPAVVQPAPVITSQYRSLPLYRGRRLAGDIVSHSGNAMYFIDDSSRYLFQEIKG